MYKKILFSFCFVVTFTTLFAQTNEDLQKEIAGLKNQLSNMRHSFDRLNKSVDDIMWYNKVGDVAFIDKVELTGPPPAKIKNPTGQGAKNPLRFKAYIFIPKNIDSGQKYPLLVLPHGGVHSNFNTFYSHIIRELMAQQYIVFAAEYR